MEGETMDCESAGFESLWFHTLTWRHTVAKFSFSKLLGLGYHRYRTTWDIHEILLMKALYKLLNGGKKW